MSDLLEHTSQHDAPHHQPAPRSRKASTAQWTRWLHVYTSMISLVIVLFFGLTGLTLNHPTWSFGGGTDTEVVAGTLPSGFARNGTVDFLAVSEFVRATHDVRGAVKDHGATATEGTISYKNPGYAADLVFDVTTGEYRLTIEEQGLLGALNDLHKGRDTDPGWRWIIDASAVFLVVVAITGLGIQLFQRKRRRRALSVAATLGVLTIAGIVLALR